MKILITGGAGFIGSHIADLLIQRNHNIVIIDNLSTGKKENINIKARFYHEDLCNIKNIYDIFKKEKPEIIYHCAAQINLRESIKNPVKDAKNNIINTLHLLNLAVKYNVRHFIFSSTGGALYGDMPMSRIPTTEIEKENPLSPYGCSKLSVEKYLKFYNKVYGLKYTSLRYSNVYGPRQNSKGEAGVIAVFLDNMQNNKNPVIYGGVQTRDFVYVQDVAYANFLVLNDDKSDIYNIGTGKQTDIIEIFGKINQLYNNKFKPEFKEMKKGKQKRSSLSHNKITSELGWIPRVNLDEGIYKTYTWFLKNNEVLV